MEQIKLEDGAANGLSVTMDPSPVDGTNNIMDIDSPSPAAAVVDEVKSRSASVGTPGSARPAPMSRRASQKVHFHEPQLFGHLPDATPKACADFQVIPDCLYGSKNMGSTDNDAFDCDCREEWRDGVNVACGEDSDCINRATKVECSASGGNCRNGCQNQRFQRKEYANVSVIQTEKKGFGLRTDSDLDPNDFIFEYIGEVINEPTFRRRMLQYDHEGIKHFYFMSLSKSEFVDATKKGNLGRFCNHSCSPNCYVDKWVVGDKLRMGIFALRKVRAGEELVFNYNVDRYGAEPQPCYCSEPNCVGFIGGKTQTERATKLPAATVEALGIDAGDGWDTAIAKKPRKKRPDESDEEYVNSIQPRGLDDEDARKVMATLMQCKEKWIAVKLLERIERCDDDRVIHIVMRMHAYQILKTVLNTFIEDDNVVLQVLEILEKLPRLTRNKIQDSKIEATVERLVPSEHEEVATKSKFLLEDWSKLELGYRIRRRKVDPNAPSQSTLEDRRGAQSREDEQARQNAKPASPQTIDAPRGPRSTAPQRSGAFFANPRPRRAFPDALPQGWFANKDARGNTYFYNNQGATTWKRPTQPAPEPSKGPSKAMQEQAAIQSIIDRVTKEGTTKQSTPQATSSAENSTPDPKKEKWRSLSTDKQMKIYENTVFPTVKHVVDKFRNKLPKDELKRLGKEVAKKLVASDFKNQRVGDPTADLSEKQAAKIKKYVKDFLDRAVEKYNHHQKRKGHGDGSKPKGDGDGSTPKPALELGGTALDSMSESPFARGSPARAADAADVSISDVEGGTSPEGSDRKRKREVEAEDTIGLTSPNGPEAKRPREDGTLEGSPPPPPPPPPDGSIGDGTVEEERALREQEEALQRENEEAQRLEDEAVNTKRLEDATRDLEKEIAAAAPGARDQTPGLDGERQMNGTLPRGGGQKDGPGSRSDQDQTQTRKPEITSH